MHKVCSKCHYVHPNHSARAGCYRCGEETYELPTLKQHTAAQAEIARLKAEVERLRAVADGARIAISVLEAKAHNDAIEAAAKWCEENGMAINLKHQGPYSGYVSHPVQDTYGMRHEGKGYASAIRALKRPT